MKNEELQAATDRIIETVQTSGNSPQAEGLLGGLRESLDAKKDTKAVETLDKVIVSVKRTGNSVETMGLLGDLRAVFSPKPVEKASEIPAPKTPEAK